MSDRKKKEAGSAAASIDAVLDAAMIAASKITSPDDTLSSRDFAKKLGTPGAVLLAGGVGILVFWG